LTFGVSGLQEKSCHPFSLETSARNGCQRTSSKDETKWDRSISLETSGEFRSGEMQRKIASESVRAFRPILFAIPRLALEGAPEAWRGICVKTQHFCKRAQVRHGREIRVTRAGIASPRPAIGRPGAGRTPGRPGPLPPRRRPPPPLAARARPAPRSAWAALPRGWPTAAARLGRPGLLGPAVRPWLPPHARRMSPGATKRPATAQPVGTKANQSRPQPSSLSP
jgi:hypothetical protein